MTTDQARGWLINASLSATGLLFVFLVLAPLAGFPLEFQDALRLLRIAVPTFVGYLGTATHFLFVPKNKAPTDADIVPHLSSLAVGPPVLFFIITACSLSAFGYANRESGPPGSGM
jgi:hypothetical protein